MSEWSITNPQGARGRCQLSSTSTQCLLPLKEEKENKKQKKRKKPDVNKNTKGSIVLINKQFTCVLKIHNLLLPGMEYNSKKCF